MSDTIFSQFLTYNIAIWLLELRIDYQEKKNSFMPREALAHSHQVRYTSGLQAVANTTKSIWE
jgi:hypothetical protein